MIAPLLKKNTLGQTQFELTSDGFNYKGVAHAFHDVVEVRSYRVIHQTRHVPVGVTTSHDPAMSLVVVLRGGEQVQVTEQSTLTSSSNQERVEQIQAAYDRICSETFPSRAKKYSDQVDALGYFEYSGWRFSPKQRKLTDPAGRALEIAKTQLLKSYGFIEVVPENEGLASKLLRKSKQELSGKRYGIGTLVDTDVFFALMAHYFQLRWQA